jgi:hypothetical protein
MAAADVLTATGGLPPSAFSLLPQDAYFPSFTSINDTILPHPDDHSNFYVDGAFDPLLKDLGPNQYGKLQYNYADPGVGQNVHFEDQLEGQGLGELLELQCDCVAICCCAHTVDSWFQDVVTPDPIERVQTSLPSINTANIQDGRGSSTRASLNNVIEDDSFAERRPKKPTPQKFAHPPVAYRAAPAEMKAERSRPAFTSSAKIALDDLFQLEPYPDDAEITSIAENTKMTIKQVKTWFSNKRSRSQRSGMRPV